MYVKRNLGIEPILRASWKNVLFFALWAALAYYLYYSLGWKFIGLAFEPLTVIGIAVSFYLGFKNSQSYDRFWEARKIWGSIVNYSRTWGNQILSLSQDSRDEKRTLIYRHLAWINALRVQLREPTSFSLKKSKSLKKDVEHYEEPQSLEEILRPFLSEEELRDLRKRKNAATHLVKNQGQHLKKLREEERIDAFQNLMLHKLLEELYNFQGACERIKNTPFPRQYAYFGTLFAWFFVLLLPFGLLNAFNDEILGLDAPKRIWMQLGEIGISTLLSWIFIMMDKVGSNSEDPFEGRFNDVPMTAICRNIEIDLRDMLDEAPLPEKVVPKNNILY